MEEKKEEQLTAVDHDDSWGYLIKADKTPTARLEALLRGIAAHIVGRDLLRRVTPSPSDKVRTGNHRGQV